MLKILLLEDEEYIRAFLCKVLNEIPGITEVFAASNGEDAISWARDNQPQILLLDIELGEGSANGLDVAKEIITFNKDACIVFITGYPQYAIESFEVHPYSYVLKPINISRFKALIAEIIDKIEDRSKLDSDILAIKTRDESLHINKDDIYFIEAHRHKTFIHTQSGLVEARRSLDELETILGKNFLRLHRSYIVNLKKIMKIREIADRSYEIEFWNFPETAYMSRNYYQQYKNSFEL